MSMIVARFTREKETKNTIRYAEQGDEAGHKFGYVYIKKAALTKVGTPDELEVWFGPPEPKED